MNWRVWNGVPVSEADRTDDGLDIFAELAKGAPYMFIRHGDAFVFGYVDGDGNWEIIDTAVLRTTAGTFKKTGTL